MRVGRLSDADKAYIRANAYRVSTEKIAADLERTVEAIQHWIDLNVAPPRAKVVPRSGEDEAKKVLIRQELRNSEAWKNLKMEFVAEELKFFEEGYIKLMSQFKNDVLHSEEIQVMQAVKYDILMSRNLQQRKKALEDIKRVEDIQGDFLSPFEGDVSRMSQQQREFALSLETQLNIARASEQSWSNEYIKLQQRHDSLMQSLKAVRDQRIKEIESSKVNFLSVIKMLQDQDVQEREARQMQLMRLAGEAEYERLGRPHGYEDGNEDSPILSADTVDLGPEEKEDVEQGE